MSRGHDFNHLYRSSASITPCFGLTISQFWNITHQSIQPDSALVKFKFILHHHATNNNLFLEFYKWHLQPASL